jgi:hypothetical protein
MKLHSRLLSILAITSTAALTNCGGGSGYSYQNITISVSPHITSIPVNTTMTFTATVTNAPDTSIEWILLSYASADLGSPTVQAGGSTFKYTAPPTPPIYTGAGFYGNTQGTVTLQATVPEFSGGPIDTQTFVVTAPSVTVGLSPATATVALNATRQFNGYAVGNVNGALTWQVNGVTGGSTATGTIVSLSSFSPGVYVYTAPSAMPMTGNTVTITVISQADPTKTASSVVTLTSP